jgi:hypothetical protein
MGGFYIVCIILGVGTDSQQKQAEAVETEDEATDQTSEAKLELLYDISASQ